MEQQTTLAATAATVPTESVTVNDRQLVYRKVGQGEPIILCQRFRGNLDDWDPAFLDLLGRYYTLYLFDYSGFGCSTGQPNTDMMGFARDVIDLADGLGLDTFHLCGWSFGGWVAQIVTTEFAARVQQLVLLGTKPPGAVKHPITELFFERAYIEDNSFEDEVILFFEPASESSRAAAKASHDRIRSRTTYRDVKIPPPLWAYYGKGGGRLHSGSLQGP
ncbi:alpha/beta fold hydrolase [Paraflavitalea pollutisoli]|uniref:alpha/beta fold hydrolase n=1 Tax=Paraflavitalea pollutisoli TaxID=3034143 RepID=UPI0023EB3B91|nr:alpha/beta fold hydrolase [Paraflavitalea sp. H1-2-19X]